MLPFLLLLISQAPASPERAALVSLARQAVCAEVARRPVPRPDGDTPPRPVFVTIERGGKVLGCRGSLEARTRSLEAEVVLSARSAAAHDPRYRPLAAGDLDDFLVTVTVVDRLESLPGADAARRLTPEDGLVLKAGGRTGVVLPWEGRDGALRLRWAYRKAGVPEGAPCRLYRMVAERTRG